MRETNVVLEVIQRDHEQIETLFNQLLLTKRGDKFRREGWIELRREISRHSLLEEEVLYPPLRRMPATEAFTRIAMVQHGTIDRLVTRLDLVPKHCSRWELTLGELRDLMVTHMQMEECELRQVVPRAFRPKELAILGSRLRAGRAA